jgi:hypothetical protein
MQGYADRLDIWDLAISNALVPGLIDNESRHYSFGPTSSINEADFNQKALRFRRGPNQPNPGDPTGEINAHVLFIHTTGDGIVPVSELRISLQRIVDMGRSDLAKVRIWDRPDHCGFGGGEYISALNTLADWVEKKAEPPSDYSSPSSILSQGG